MRSLKTDEAENSHRQVDLTFHGDKCPQQVHGDILQHTYICFGGSGGVTGGAVDIVEPAEAKAD